MYAKMTGEQQELYQAHVQRLQMLLSKQSPEEFDHSRIQILSELTKLRQLCCDPALLYEKYTSGSAKLDLCLELIHNAMESGHKMLVFPSLPLCWTALPKDCKRNTFLISC